MNSFYNSILIEEVLYNICKAAGTSDNIFSGRRPEATDESLESFVVVRMTGNIKDLGIIGLTMGTIYLYAKNLAGGIKNNKVLLDMHKTLESSFPYIDPHFIIENSRYGQETGFPDTNGYYVIAINLDITIK